MRRKNKLPFRKKRLKAAIPAILACAVLFNGFQGNIVCANELDSQFEEKESMKVGADFYQPTGQFVMGSSFPLSATTAPDALQNENVSERNNKVVNEEPVKPVDKTFVETEKFHVKDIVINISPQDVTSDEGTEKIKEKYVNKDAGLDELHSITTEVTAHFRAKGYPAATAYIPEQNIANGTLQINVELGRYGKVEIENQGHLKEKVIKGLTNNLKHGNVIKNREIETSVYNIIGLGGVQAGAIMRPGQNLGETDVVVRVIGGKQDSYTLYADNYGSKSSGRYRYNFAFNMADVSGNGDSLSANVLISNAKQHNYGIYYNRLVGHSGTKLGIGYSSTDYELGSHMASIGAIGRSKTLSLSGSTPLWNTSNDSFVVSYGFDFRDLKDELRNFDYVVQKRSYTGHLGIGGFFRLPKSTVQYGLTGYLGTLRPGEAHVGPYPLNISPKGRYSKVVFSTSIIKEFNKEWDIVMRLQAQKAANELDSSEKMYLGGANGIRAYPQGEGSGDEGYQATAELRYHTKVRGLTLSTYLDIGHIKYSRDASSPGGTTLKGWGIGVDWSRPNDFFLRLDYARRIGLPTDASNNARAKQRIWFMVGKRW